MKNKPALTVQFSGYGHYKISTTYYGKKIECITDNMPAVDDFKDDNEHTSNTGYKVLRSICIAKNKAQR